MADVFSFRLFCVFVLDVTVIDLVEPFLTTVLLLRLPDEEGNQSRIGFVLDLFRSGAAE